MMKLVPYLEEREGHLLVGARASGSDYEGPAAEVYIRGDWLHVVTDSYEGNAMLNKEALPKLIEALQRLEDPKP